MDGGGYLGGGNFKYCLFSPRKFGEDEPILTCIFFHMGWFNHQIVMYSKIGGVHPFVEMPPRLMRYDARRSRGRDGR